MECLNPRFHRSSVPNSSLCVLRLLFLHPLVSMLAGPGERKGLIPQGGKELQTAEIQEDAEGTKNSQRETFFYPF
jgi:hypothetical protein